MALNYQIACANSRKDRPMTDPDTAPKATEQPIRFRPVVSADNLVGMRMDRDGGYIRYEDYEALADAPDHGTWNAAIEAAARELEGAIARGVFVGKLPDHVRALKKGPTND